MRHPLAERLKRGQNVEMDIENLYPDLTSIKKRAKSRLPEFAFEYLDSATGAEDGKSRNRKGLDKVLFKTKMLKGALNPDLKTTFLGREYDCPFGIAPIGMSGMIWPGAEMMLAQGAVRNGMPYSLSTVATQDPEKLAPHIGNNGWFQLYPPTDPDVRRDIIRRAKEAGFHTLILTVDVPAPSRRERQKKAQLTMPTKITPRMLIQSALNPTWSLGTLRYGIPRLRLAESYLKIEGTVSSTKHAGYVIRGTPDWDYLAALKEEWDGPLLVKGATNGEDAVKLQKAGVDAVWVSNHSARQFDGGQASIDNLRDIRSAVGPDMPLIFDSGIEGGLDILRAYATGADFVMLGRAFHYATAAFGKVGVDHMAELLRDDIISCMGQMGIDRPIEARDCLI